MAETATALQLSFEEAVVESYNLYETATKGNWILVLSLVTARFTLSVPNQLIMSQVIGCDDSGVNLWLVNLSISHLVI